MGRHVGAPILSRVNMKTATQKIAELEARVQVLEQENARLVAGQPFRQQLELLLDNLPDAVCISTLAGQLLYLNRAARTLYGIDAKVEIPRSIEDLMPEQSLQLCRRERVPEAIAQGIWVGESSLPIAGNEVIPTLQMIVAPKNQQGRVENIFWIERDQRELKRLEMQFVQAQRMEALGTLIGGIAHDFNNLLAGILGNVFLLLRQADAGPQQDRLKAVQRMCQNAAGMVAQLLVLARKDAIANVALKLKNFMAEFGKMYQVLIPENISFELGDIADDLAVMTDLPQFQQIMINLLTNARDALEGCVNPTIGVAIEAFEADQAFLEKHQTVKQRQLVRISVIDNGCGIAPDMQAKIFEPFFTTKKVSKGSGLGLAMVYGAITRQQGVIEILSNVNQGTIVRLYLPRVPADAVPAVSAEVEGLAYGQGELLILADDDDFVRDSHKDALIQLGYRVLPVADGQQAVDTFRECPQVALVICDIVMPNLDGVTAGRLMRDINPDLPLLYLSGYADRTDREKLADLPPGAEILKKPANIEQLSQKVARLLRQR